jgi:integrase
MFKLQDGKLHVYKRTESRFYWCKFYHKRVPFRTSTQTEDLEKAKDFARQWYFERQLEIKTGKVAPTTNVKSFAVAAEKALEAYKRDVERGTRSQSYYKGLEKLIRNRVVPTLGKHALASINQGTWNSFKEHLMTKKRPVKAKTIHQYKIAIRIVLKQAQVRGELPAVPQFLEDQATLKDDTPRTWFNADEYKVIIKAVRDNIKLHKNTRWREDAEELRDYVLFVANSGLRIGEARHVRLCDVEITEDYDGRTKQLEPCLLIKNLKGKRGTGSCKSYFGAVRPFERCLERHVLTTKNYQQSAAPLFKAYHRNMFREVLERVGLRFTKDQPPKRRDLMSFRHTYICFRLLEGVPVHAIAANCRTSVAMIENHYARWLDVSMSKTINMTAPKAVYNVTD